MSLHRPDFDLYLITDRHLAGSKGLLWVIEEALEGGVRAIQLREKDLAGRELYLLAEKVKALCTRWHASLFINDRIDVALAVGADGVHLAGSSMPIPVTRGLIGAKRSIGVSVHSLEAAQEAEKMGADFLVFGPIYFTPSKMAYGSPQGLEQLKKVVEKVSVRVYPIGGFEAQKIAEIKQVGLREVALISAIIASPRPRQATQEILRALKE